MVLTDVFGVARISRIIAVILIRIHNVTRDTKDGGNKPEVCVRSVA